MGYHSEIAILPIIAEGTQSQAKNAIKSGIKSISGRKNLPTQIRQAVDIALQSTDVGINKNISQSLMVFVDKDKIVNSDNVYQVVTKLMQIKLIISNHL